MPTIIKYNQENWRGKKLAHQLEGVRFLLRQPHAALFDEMGVGKTKQVIDAACTLFQQRLITSVVVIAKAAVRGVWDEPEDGELERWCWLPYAAMRYDNRTVRRGLISIGPNYTDDPLVFWITNYELLRRKEHLTPFLNICRALGPFWLVLDESSMIKSRSAQQTKATLKVRELENCVRATLLNGTPIANNYMDLWSQFNVLDPKILDNKNYYQFRNRYAVMGGWNFKQVVSYDKPAVEALNKKLQRWVIRREKKDCLDLPPKLYTRIEVPLSTETFALYRQMRDEMIAWTKTGEPRSIATHGATKALRLAQLCAGFLGGTDLENPKAPAEEVSREKLDYFLEWQQDHPESMLIWCRFRPEQTRCIKELQMAGRNVFVVQGGQSDRNRQDNIIQFKQTPGAILVGQPQAGGWGLNLTVASTVSYLSNDYNLVTREQSEDRAHREGQKVKVTYLDFLATTPKGNHTVDHVILKALLKKEDLAAWTYGQWRTALQTGD